MSDEPRMYGGNSWRKGVPEDTTRCIETVSSSSVWDGVHQCTRKRGHGPGGLWCKQHGRIAEERESRRRERDATEEGEK